MVSNTNIHDKNLSSIANRSQVEEIVKSLKAESDAHIQLETYLQKGPNNKPIDPEMLKKHKTIEDLHAQLLTHTEQEVTDANQFTQDFESLRTDLALLQKEVGDHIIAFVDNEKELKKSKEQVLENNKDLKGLTEELVSLQGALLDEVTLTIEKINSLMDERGVEKQHIDTMKIRLKEELDVLNDMKNKHMGDVIKELQKRNR